MTQEVVQSGTGVHQPCDSWPHGGHGRETQGTAFSPAGETHGWG